MNHKKCSCTYFKLKERGYEPIDHAWSCPLSKGFYKKTPKRFVFPEGDNPYGATDRFKEYETKDKSK
jgi:hypothetical protein